ncbi:hypothetical protein JXL83_09480 [candidate division WOR-3 bacterium]|nr:hypothetical protein [candidate division WOR-3 bacterium]
MTKEIYKVFAAVLMLLLPAAFYAGVCIPGVGCFSGVEGCEITTPWYNPGYLYTYQKAIEKNAVGVEYGERFPGTDRWGFLHYRLGKNYIGLAANRKQYLGGYPFDTTYFRPRISAPNDVFPYMLDSIKPPTYLVDVIVSRNMFGGGAGLNVHFGSKSQESEYDYFLTQSHIKAEPSSNSFGAILGIDNKSYYITAGFDYLTWNSDFEIVDTLNDTNFVDFENTYTSANLNFQYKKWIDQTRYITLPTLSFNYDNGSENFSSRELGHALNPENERNKYSLTTGLAFDDMGIPNSFSVGVNFIYTRTVNEFQMDTVFTDMAADTIFRTLPGKATIDEYTFPQMYFSANFFIWKWLSANASVNYSIKYTSSDVERSYAELDGGSYVLRKTLQKKTGFEREISFDLGAEITVLEDLKINFVVDDKILFDEPYLISGDKSFLIVTKITAWYQF